MATISKTWRAEATPMNAVTLADATESFSSDVNLETDGYEASHVTVDVTFGASPEFGVSVAVYGSLDGTNYDDIPMFSQGIAEVASTAQQISLIIKDVAHFRIGMAQGGTVTNDATVTIKEQSWRYQSA